MGDWVCARVADEIQGSLNHDGAYGVTFPLGAIVATCTLVDVVPMVDLDASRDALILERPHLWVDGTVAKFWQPNQHPIWTDVTDQRPYGLFEPGRYAWLLADVVPVDPPVPFKGGQGLTRRWVPLAA